MARHASAHARLKKLRSDAADIWGDQREVLDHAGDSSGRPRAPKPPSVAKNDVAPRSRRRRRPGQARRRAGCRPAPSAAPRASTAKERLVNDVAPAVSAAVASSPLVDRASTSTSRRSRSRQEAQQEGQAQGAEEGRASRLASTPRPPRTSRRRPKASKFQKQRRRRRASAPVASSSSSWASSASAPSSTPRQTLRADDELWIADDDDSHQGLIAASPRRRLAIPRDAGLRRSQRSLRPQDPAASPHLRPPGAAPGLPPRPAPLSPASAATPARCANGIRPRDAHEHLAAGERPPRRARQPARM